MSRAGPVRRDGSFSRDPSTSERHSLRLHGKISARLADTRHYNAGIPANRAEIFSCNRVHRDSPVSRATFKNFQENTAYAKFWRANKEYYIFFLKVAY